MLTAEERALATLAAAVAAGDAEALAGAVAAATRDASSVAVEEVLLQSHLFVGFPRAMEAMRVWREAAGEGASQAEVESGGEAEWARRGERVCALVYGGQYGRLRENVARLHPELERWMLVDGYGKVLGRPGVALRLRELCVVAQLAVLGAPRQLYSHLRGALNAGATVAQLEQVLALAAEAGGGMWAAEARGVFEKLRSRVGSGEI